MKPAIPRLNSGNAAIDSFADTVKQSLDTMTGQQKNAVPLAPLAPTATTAQIITQLNAILTRLQG